MLNAIFSKFGYEIRDVGTFAKPGDELTRLLTGGSSTAAGVSVNAETALRSPTTLACVRVLSESIGSLPIHVFRRGDNGGRERERAHPVAELLSGDWAPWAGGVETRTALQFDALLHGVGYGQVIRAGARPVEIHRLEPLAVTEDIDPASGEPSYRIRQANGGERKLGWRDVLAIRTPGSAPGRKLCLIDLCREAISVDILMARDQGRIFRNSARPGGAVTVQRKLSDVAFARLKASLEGDYSGENAGKTMLLEEGATWQTTSTFSAEQMQFLELRQFAIREIGRAFKVPGPLIGDLERATWRNVEELNRQFLTLTLLPWLDAWEAALTRVLLSPADRTSIFLEFTTEDLLRADLAGRFAAYRNAVGGAWMAPNEARRLENRPPIEGGDDLIRQAGQSDTGATPPATTEQDRQAA